jgi:transcriptional regulator with XRE-family HTH domain
VTTTKSAIHVYKRIGAVIRVRRDAVGVSAQELADKSGVTRAQISNLEAGNCGVTIHTLSGIARGLRCKAWEILRDANL